MIWASRATRRQPFPTARFSSAPTGTSTASRRTKLQQHEMAQQKRVDDFLLHEAQDRARHSVRAAGLDIRSERETDNAICPFMRKTFGKFLKEKRLALNLSLREFARKVGLQPSNYCNVEADVLPPPPENALERIAKALGLRQGTKDFEKFYDLAAKGRDEIPADVTRIV